MMWMFDAGDGFDRSRDLLAEAERERFIRSVQPRRTSTRRSQVRQRVGLALIRHGENLAGVTVNPTPRLS